MRASKGRRTLLFALAGLMAPATGCRRETRNTFEDALASATRDGGVIVEQGQTDKSGYAIWGDARPPKSRITFLVVAQCQDEGYLGPDKEKPVWASVLREEYKLDGRTLANTGMQADRFLRPAVPLKDLRERWEGKWKNYLAAQGLTVPEAERAKMKAVMELMQGQIPR